MTRTRIVASAAVAVLALAGCGSDDPTLPAGVGESPASSPEPGEGTPTASEREPESDEIALETWFTEIESLHLSYRQVERVPGVGSAAMQQLLAGPVPEDLAVDVGTAIPAGTTLLGLDVDDDGVATVDLSSEFESGGGSMSMRMRLAQVVYTLTQFPTVDGVLLRIEGEDVEALGGEGVLIDHPLGRRDFRDFAPPITVSSPKPNSEVTSPVTIAGTANVFEATVSIRIVDEDGDRLAKAFTTATCGTGCRGDYSEAVELGGIDEAQEGFIEVFQASPEDGSPMFVVRIPVLLVP